MALTACKECGAKISDKAEACPHCGLKRLKRKGPNVFVVIIVGVFAVIAMSELTKSNPSTTATPPVPARPKTPSQADLEINAALDIARGIKRAAKNPASFKLESFLIYPGGATCYEYRAANSFNALVPGKAVFLPAKGQVLVQEKDGNRFIKAWNDTCTQPGGQERAGGINALNAV